MESIYSNTVLFGVPRVFSNDNITVVTIIAYGLYTYYL